MSVLVLQLLLHGKQRGDSVRPEARQGRHKGDVLLGHLDRLLGLRGRCGCCSLVCRGGGCISLHRSLAVLLHTHDKSINTRVRKGAQFQSRRTHGCGTFVSATLCCTRPPESCLSGEICILPSNMIYTLGGTYCTQTETVLDKFLLVAPVNSTTDYFRISWWRGRDPLFMKIKLKTLNNSSLI
jgi:hypothetical protein